MGKKEAKRIQKQIDDLENQLSNLEIRPCTGDSELKQKEVEIADLQRDIKVLKIERDEHIYGLPK